MKAPEHESDLPAPGRSGGARRPLREAIYRAVQRGELGAVRLCSRLRIPRAAFDEGVERGRVRPQEPERWSSDSGSRAGHSRSQAGPTRSRRLCDYSATERRSDGGADGENPLRRHLQPTPGGGDCRCPYQATVYSARERKLIRKQFERLGEARTWREDARGAVRAGKMRAPKPTTLPEAWEAFHAGVLDGTIRNRKGEPYKPSACRSYKRAMEKRVLPYFEGVKLSQVTRRDVQDFVDVLVAEGLDGSTIKNTLNPLQAIFRRAVRRDEIMVNPTRELELPRARGRRARVPTPTEAAKLIAAMPEPERALWATAIYTGLRRGELQELRWSDVDLSRGMIRVERAWDDEGRQVVDVKTEAGVRTALIVAPLRAELVEHGLRTKRAGDDLVFGRTARERFVPSTVRRHAREAWERPGSSRSRCTRVGTRRRRMAASPAWTTSRSPT